MKRIVGSAVPVLLVVSSMASAQTKDANQVMADVKAALGGEKLAGVLTLAGAGRSMRTGPAGNTIENEFELALELPDKYRLRAALVALGNMSVYRHTGFNGSQVIEEIDQPPNLAGGGHVVIRVAGPAGAPQDPAKMTPEQKAEADRQKLAANKREFARLALGLFGGSLPAQPLQFAYAGEAESPDGKADVIDVRGENGFEGRLFVDGSTHLPLMLTWKDKEPLIIQTGGPGGTRVASGGGGAVFGAVGGGGGGAGAHGGQWTAAEGGARPPLSAADREKLEKDLEAARAEADAKRRVVEYRIYYGDYQAVGGVKLPHRIQRSIDGKTTEEMIFESYKINSKIDQDTFKPSK
jgi:hypothetical protein